MTQYEERLIATVNSMIGRVPEGDIANVIGYLEGRFARVIFEAEMRELEELRRAARMAPKKRPIIEAGGNIVLLQQSDGGTG